MCLGEKLEMSSGMLRALGTSSLLKRNRQTILLLLMLKCLSLWAARLQGPRLSSDLGRMWEFCASFFFHFSTISRECFICIIKEQCERKMVTVFQGQTHFCQPDYVRNEGHFHGDNCLTLATAGLTIITFRQDLGNNLEGSCERSNKLTWILKIQLDTSLWLCLHSCWNVLSIKRFQLSSAKKGRICVLPNALSQA